MAETGGRDLLREAFTLIAELGWRRFSLVELARRTERTLEEVYAEIPSRPAVVTALGRRLDAAMLRIDLEELAGLNPRERVFELIMQRFDAMRPFKPGIRALSRENPPELLPGAACNLGRATGWLLDASGVELGPLRSLGAGPALGLVYGRTFNIWLDDDSEDQGATLAELDKRLQQAERVAQWTAWLDRRNGPSEEPAAG